MITQIKVLSRFQIINVLAGMDKLPFSDWHLISIYGWPFSPVLTDKSRKEATKLGCISSLSLKFNDFTEEQYEAYRVKYPTSIKKVKLFDDKLARTTIEYLKEINDMDGSHGLVVHCHMGISRSGAIASFAADRYEINFWDDIRPNQLVLRILQQNI